MSFLDSFSGWDVCIVRAKEEAKKCHEPVQRILRTLGEIESNARFL
jgi:hypothetical protein